MVVYQVPQFIFLSKKVKTLNQIMQSYSRIPGYIALMMSYNNRYLPTPAYLLQCYFFQDLNLPWLLYQIGSALVCSVSHDVHVFYIKSYRTWIVTQISTAGHVQFLVLLPVGQLFTLFYTYSHIYTAPDNQFFYLQ